MLIRRATRSDAESIATFFLLAMEDIVFGFIGERDSFKAKQFLTHFVQQENNQYSYENCWVAELNEEIVAAVGLYDGALLQKLRQPVLEQIRLKYNPHFEPEDETQPGEYYIDCLGVRTDQQGKGIGAKMLSHIIEEYAIKDGVTLGLLVEEGNASAQRLYLKLGFKAVGNKMLFGKRMHHMQVSGR